MRRRWRGRVEAVEASDAVLAGDDGARLRVPADWLPGAGPGDSVHLALRLTRRPPERSDAEVVRHAPWLDTLSLVALAVGVGALVYHLFLR
jgi:hypothetical protein